jgi:hypothetical protein
MLVKQAAVGWVFLLAACHPQAVNLEVTVFPDGAGKARTLTIHPLKGVSGEEANPGGLMKGATEHKLKQVSVDLRDAVFADLNRFELGGIRFEFRKLEEGFEALVRIPCHAESEWYKALGISDAEVRAFDEARKTGQIPDLPENFDLRVLFSIVMPGVISSQRTEPETGKTEVDVPAELAISFERDKKIKANLFVPVKEIFQGSARELVWTIRSGKVSAHVQREWARFKEQYPGRDK